ncbi:MAG: hypothetical protein JRJ16_18210 [Deltaproteobacteria bacterium]|nr:hypothetical protein [Deltaproteobacteria bacterium]
MKGRLIGVVAMVLVLFFCCPNTRATDPGTRKSYEDQEKRSCIKAVDGYAYLSDKMTLSEIRSAAFADAKRKALEMAKAYIASKTKMANFSVQYDVVWSESEGSVSVLEQKDYGIEDNARYHVWIKAEVEYSLAPKGKARYEDIRQENAPLTVKVWTSNGLQRRCTKKVKT